MTTGKSISEILDTAFNSDHTNGSHADDPSDKRPCYCHNRQYAEQALTAREASIRKDELKKLPKSRWKDHEYCVGWDTIDDRIKQIERG